MFVFVGICFFPFFSLLIINHSTIFPPPSKLQQLHQKLIADPKNIPRLELAGDHMKQSDLDLILRLTDPSVEKRCKVSEIVDALALMAQEKRRPRSTWKRAGANADEKKPNVTTAAEPIGSETAVSEPSPTSNDGKKVDYGQWRPAAKSDYEDSQLQIQ
jgi:hypothetical protein